MNRPFQEPPPRHDPEAEAVVLSACMLSSEALDELLPMLRPDDFLLRSNRWMWGAIVDLVGEGEQVDTVAVSSRLRAEGKLERVGGTPYILNLVDSVPTLAHPEQHARTVLDLARARRAAAVFQRLAGEARGDVGDVGEWLERCEADVYRITTEDAPGRDTVADYQEMTRLAMRWVETAARGPGYTGVPTGFTALDNHVGGMEAGHLWFVGGRPGAGKSTWVRQAGEHAGSLGWGVVDFTLEMPLLDLMLRSVSRRARIPHSLLRSGRLTTAHWSALTEQLAELARLPIIVDDGAQLTPTKLRSKLRRHTAALRKRFPEVEVKLVIIDHTQLMDADAPGDNRNTELTHISRQLKRLAKEFGVCVLALSQMSRPKKGERPKRPELHDLRESGALEQDADVVMFIHRQDPYLPPEERTGEAELVVAKGRHCGPDVHRCKFDGRHLTFTEEEPELPYGEEPL